MSWLDNDNNGLPFLKMHGLGNDFVIIDARGIESLMTKRLAQAIGQRHFGVGFDQLVIMRDSENADIDITFWNSDGSQANSCGNASRCVSRLMMDELKKTKIILQTKNGLLSAEAKDELISINMGQPQLTWQEIPLARDVNLIALPLDGAPSAVGMGNPHCVFVVADVAKVNLETEGELIEHHALFPERTNVEFIQILDRKNIRMRVWERGGMVTLACGSGACAAGVVGYQKGLTERKVSIHLDGGLLGIDWRDDGVWMTGATKLVFKGTLSSEFLSSI